MLVSLSTIKMPVTEQQGLAVKLTQKLATGDVNARDIAQALSALAQWDTQVSHDSKHVDAMRAMIQHFTTTLHHSGGQQAPNSRQTAQF